MTEARLADLHQLHGLQPVLAVADLAASLRFYCELLGLEPDFLWGEPPHYGRVKRLGHGAPIYLHLSQSGSGEPPSPATLRLHVGHDVDGLFTAYAARGASVAAPPTNRPWGLREFALRDPDGHLLIFGAEA
jgi:catechol 2,3-dioxygenase-like lactoylglutathione lyase family enzyme